MGDRDSTDDQFSSEHDNTMLIDDDARDEEDGESAGLQAPPRHYCGIGRFRPKCLQVFATKKFFTFILCVYCLIEGAVTTGECVHGGSVIVKRSEEVWTREEIAEGRGKGGGGGVSI